MSNLSNVYKTTLPKKQLNFKRNEETMNNLVDGRSFLDSDVKVKIGSNNNMELISRYVNGTVENTKYFNYYKPDHKKPVSLLSELTQNISTVEALDAEYLKQDGYII